MLNEPRGDASLPVSERMARLMLESMEPLHVNMLLDLRLERLWMQQSAALLSLHNYYSKPQTARINGFCIP